MKILTFKDNEVLYSLHTADIYRIQDICKSRGYIISFTDAKAAWKSHSDDYAAGWLILDVPDDYIFEVVKSKCEVTTDEEIWNGYDL